MHRFRWKLVTPVHTARLLIIGTVSALAVGLGAAPALAANPSGTDVTFEIQAGGLDLTTAADADLGDTAVSGAAITATLGAVSVLDTRASADSSWTATAVSSAFVTGAGTGTSLIAATNVRYWSGAVTANSGTGTATGQQLTAPASVQIDTAKSAVVNAGGSGNNTVTWSPTLIVNVPISNVAGVYTGTVTHSVA